jgi:Flp pilus assembly protein TadG
MNAVRRDEGGQAVIIAALAMVVLMGAIALTLDWGYGFVLRRGMQSAVDAATLAAARHVVSTFELASGTPSFDATQEDICDEVAARAAGLGTSLQLAFIADPADPPSWTTISTANCSAGHNDSVPSDTQFVRVQATRTFGSLFDLISNRAVTVSVSARARLSGSSGCDSIDCVALRPLILPTLEEPGAGVSGYSTVPNVAIWPLAMHLNLGDFATPCGQYCSRLRSSNRVTIWPRASYGPAGEFTGLLTYTHFSPREFDDTGGQIHQFTTESDYTGTTDLGIRATHGHDDASVYPVARMPNADSRACGGAASWDTIGEDSLADAADCDLPNWFAYGFRGSVGASTNWATSFNALPGPGVDRPTALTSTRASCDRSTYIPRPSCIATANQLGDWIETVPGPLTQVMAEDMLLFIGKYGRTTPASSQRIAPGGSAPFHGKAVVVYVPLWDCAERFDPAQTGSARWTLVVPAGGDCSQLGTGSSVGRVHIVSVVPFTFYEGLIRTSPVTVEAYWGNVFGDAGVCARDALAAGCDLNELMNSAYLVPDE